MLEQEELVKEQDLTYEQDYEKGIDVSYYQGTIGWKQVAASGIKQVFIKMTEGGTYIDPNFVNNWRNANEVGLKVNAYHYFRALSSTPEEQYNNIQKNLPVDFDPRSHSLAIDVEQTGNEKATKDQMADHLQALIVLIKKNILCDAHPFIYCSSGYWDRAVNGENTTLV